MAKPIRSSRRKSSGKRSPSTQEIRGQKRANMQGVTDGTFSLDAIPTAKPQFARRKPRTQSGAHSKLTREDIAQLPADSAVALNGHNQAVIALYDVEFDSVSAVIAAYAKRLQ